MASRALLAAVLSVAGLVAGLGALPAAAHEIRHGTLSIAHPFVAAVPACSTGPLRAYVLLVVNQGRETERLLGAEIDGLGAGVPVALAREAQGIVRRKLPRGLEIAAGGQAALRAPRHAIEFPRPAALPADGTVMRGRLRFEKAGAVAVDFMVEGTHLNSDPAVEPCGDPPASGASGPPAKPKARPADAHEGHHHGQHIDPHVPHTVSLAPPTQGRAVLWQRAF